MWHNDPQRNKTPKIAGKVKVGGNRKRGLTKY